jgi:hypothetical protein
METAYVRSIALLNYVIPLHTFALFPHTNRNEDLIYMIVRSAWQLDYEVNERGFGF